MNFSTNLTGNFRSENISKRKKVPGFSPDTPLSFTVVFPVLLCLFWWILSIPGSDFLLLFA